MRGVACNDCPPMWQKQQCFPRYTQLAWSWHKCLAKVLEARLKGHRGRRQIYSPFLLLFCLILPLLYDISSSFCSNEICLSKLTPFFFGGGVLLLGKGEAGHLKRCGLLRKGTKGNWFQTEGGEVEIGYKKNTFYNKAQAWVAQKGGGCPI